MNAALIISRIRASGGELSLANDRINLKVRAFLHSATVAQITEHKDAVKRLLKSEAKALWDGEDYRTYYEERAAIGEFDGGLTREKAELLACECCVVEWLNQNTETTLPDRCAWCGQTHSFNNVVIPFGTRAHGHTWLHPECSNEWNQARRLKAEQALAALMVGGNRWAKY